MSVVFILKERNKYSYSVRTHSIIELSIHQRIWKKNDLSFHKIILEDHVKLKTGVLMLILHI